MRQMELCLSVMPLFLAVTACLFAAGDVFAGIPLDLPIVQKPHEHEEVQYNYHPDYTVNVPSFDSQNRPYIRSRTADQDATGYIHTLRDGKWIKLDLEGPIRQQYPDFLQFRLAGGWHGGRITFDAADHLYTHLRILLKDERPVNLLLYSPDYGQTFQIYELPEGEIDLEYWTGHNTLTRPPLIAVNRTVGEFPLGKWTGRNLLSVIQPRKTDDGRLAFGEPVLVTDHGLNISRHSGNASFAASGPEKTFITWAEVTDTNDVPGTPTFVATFDPSTNTVSGKQHVGYGEPPNDGHNTPGLVLDSKGIIHVLTGSHGEDLFYSHSTTPYATDAGWTEPKPILETGWKEDDGAERGRQTYHSFLCDAADTLHIAFRQWRRNIDAWHGGETIGCLSYQHRPAEGQWDEQAKVLVVPPLPGYSVYYHKMSLDRLGRLFLTYAYFSDNANYTAPEPRQYFYMALIMSEDHGKSWQLATTDDFISGVGSRK